MERTDGTARANMTAVFALALGCIIGWGSFVMPITVFLPQAGVLGTLLGLLLAAGYALIIAANYARLSKAFPDADCSYLLLKGAFGMDHAFFSVWSLLLAYITVFWANAAAFALVGRFLFGRTLMRGPHYRIMGYDAYLTEILLSVLVIAVTGQIVCRGRKVIMLFMKILAGVLVVSACFLVVGFLTRPDAASLLRPAFASTGILPKRNQVLAIAVLAPWMFVGFETATHMSSPAKSASKNILPAVCGAILAGTALYFIVALCSNTGIPQGFRSWEDYVAVEGDIQIFEDMPTVLGMRRHMGGLATVFSSIAFLATLLSSLLGYLMVGTRVLKIMADDGLVPAFLTKTNEADVPVNAVRFVFAISVPVLCLGMNIIGWVVDISTLSVAIVYGYVSLAAATREDSGVTDRILGITGVILSFVIFFLMMVPNTLVGAKLVTEDYLILSAWCLAGMVYYRYVLSKDKDFRMGKSMLMWLLMFFLFFFSTNMWTHTQMEDALLSNLDPHTVSSVLVTNNLLRTIVVILAFILLFELFLLLMRRQKELDAKIILAEAKSLSKASLLSNMSHDIRTPMNAIVGFTDLALQDDTDAKAMADYLGKIKVSSAHLLSLIEDVLEMNRIESDAFRLKEAPASLPGILAQVKMLMESQSELRRHKLAVVVRSVDNENVICDARRLRQALLYLTSNALRFTQEEGIIEIGVTQLTQVKAGRAVYEFSVRDNGQGMSEEMVDRIYHSLVGEDIYTAADTQGAQLGMAITRRIIDKMNGSIEVNSKPDVGTEVFVTVELAVTDEEVRTADIRIETLAGKRALVADDIMVNRQIAIAILQRYGMQTEEAKDGAEAFEKLSSSLPGHYDVILMDIQMPNLNGYDAAKKIRGLSEPINASIPIVAMTANVFDEDRERAYDVGMNGFVPKPVDRQLLVETLADVFATDEIKE